MSTSRRTFLRSLLTGLVVAPLAARRVLGAQVEDASFGVIPIRDGYDYHRGRLVHYPEGYTPQYYTRPTAVTVQWTDPARDYTPQLLYVEDQERMALVGYSHQLVSSGGCTSEAQAQRYGRWILAQERLNHS